MKINKTINAKILVAALALNFGLSSCERDLDRLPKSEITSFNIYSDFNNYKGVLAKAYAGLAVSGQDGGDGRADIGGIDAGASNYLRQYFQLQELTTDEAIISWNDGNLPDLHNMTWGVNNEFIMAMYYRIFYQIGAVNEFIRETSDEKLASRNITGEQAAQAREFRNEARFLRALSYYHALDMFGNVPFVDEHYKIGDPAPKQMSRQELFSYVEKELLDLEHQLKAPRSNEYGRADRGAVWMLLSKLYLNANVYTNEAKYTQARTYAEKVINGGYSLKENYKDLFLADNHLNNPEVIFSINFNGLHTRTWGGTSYIIHAGIGGSMNPSEFGVNAGWGGLRTTKGLVKLFPSTDGSADVRGRFHTAGQNLDISNFTVFTEGYPLIKFKNVTSSGIAGSDPSGNFVDTDFPLFRLADAYLIYAEAVLRGGGGSRATALDYINRLRKRAKTTTINDSNLTLDFILDERGRELAWEATRRTDLIRFDKFTSSAYLWPFKGGVAAGKAVGEYRKLFPIPASDLIANPNLKQNTGY